MPCPEVHSGVAFLSSTLTFVDCHAQSIGAFGYQALSGPNAMGADVLAALLALFVGVFGYRLLLGYPIHGSDLVTSILKIGVVLTLGASWGAFRTLVYDTVLYGPAEIAGAVSSQSSLSSPYALTDRLENVDSGILALTAAGTGRSSLDETETGGGGAANRASPQGSGSAAFASVAVDDTLALGASRVAYLAGTLAPLVAFHLSAAVLTALAPLMAGFLLFEGAQGIFFGWLRALLAVTLGSVALIINLSLELALLEPWLADVLARRSGRLLTPAAPTELLVMTTTFAVVAVILVALLARLAFNSGAVIRLVRGAPGFVRERQVRAAPAGAAPEQAPSPARAARIAERLTTVYRGERRLATDGGDDQRWGVSAGVVQPSQAGGPVPTMNAAQAPLGGSYRRSTRRSSRAASTRDRRP